ncbi:CF251-like protein [Mya arenaria]|uniref:Cilia- and flagella-associated protein 251 n=1 Tax=Mya arenaria TaxID=6604 RepID=A0ABY7E2E1_MYAAR|nr:CF251-like protein [Mya arenaria]
MADEEGQKSGSPKPESPQPADPETTDAPGTPTRADAAGRKSKSPEAQEVQESKSPEPAEEGQGDAENVNENAGGEEQTDGDKPTNDGTDETQEQEGEQQEVPAETEEAQQEEQGEEQAGEDEQQAGDDEQQAEAEPAEAGERASPEGEQQQTEVDKAQEESGGKSPTQEQQQPPAAGTDARPSSQASLKSQPTERGPLEVAQIPDAPQIPSPDRPESEMEGTMSNAALNIIWSFGLNRNVRVLNLTDNTRKVIMYTCAHSNPITCTCVSEDKRWLVTGDRGKDSMVIVWDTYTGVPIQTIFDTSNSDEGGVVAVGMTPDAKYLATISAAKSQVLSIWDWTVDGDTPLCSAELKSTYGVQNFILFNPQDIHYLVTNSDSQVVFYNWSNGHMEYFAPPLTDQDFNKQVGRYSQSIFQANSSRALTATSIGNLVVWDNNKPVTKVISSEPSANKKALKIIRLQERGINVITTTDKYIVVGDVAGHVKFFDQSLKLVHWYQDLNLGPVSAVSFAFNPDFLGIAREGTNYPPDATIQARQFVIRDFVVGSSIAVPAVVIGSYSGLLKVWNYEKKQVMVSRTFERGNLIRCCSYSPNGAYLAVGFMNGSVRDAEYTVSVFVRQHGVHVAPYVYLGRNRAHYKPIKEIMFGIQLDADFPRLLSLGTDRVLVEYDLERSSKDDLQIASSDRIEQSAVPQCMTWYPPITKEHFIVTANDQFKFKLYNATTKMCRKTLLGPTYGSPVQKMCVIPTKDPARDKRYVAYITEYKVGMNILPLDGNPHNAMALIGHPSGVANMVCSNDGRYLFTAGGTDATVHMWEININALEGQSSLGGEDLIPFYGLLEGGREGELFKELEDYFYYAQIRRRLLDESQGVNAMDSREVSVKIPLSEVPFVMRAMGFYPSEQEIEDMLNEVKFSRYVETGSYVEAIDLGEFIKLYINHRPAFGLSPERLVKAFETLGLPAGKAGPAINRGDLLEMLQTKGYHAEGGSSELQEFDTNIAGDVISDHLPVDITAEMFANEVLGFGMNQDSSQGKA